MLFALCGHSKQTFMKWKLNPREGKIYSENHDGMVAFHWKSFCMTKSYTHTSKTRPILTGYRLYIFSWTGNFVTEGSFTIVLRSRSSTLLRYTCIKIDLLIVVTTKKVFHFRITEKVIMKNVYTILSQSETILGTYRTLLHNSSFIQK